MFKEKGIRLFFLLPIVFFLGWVIYLSAFTALAQEVTVRITGYDPRDLLSGHYLAYQIDWKKTNCAQFENQQCPYKEFSKIPHRFYLPEKEAVSVEKLFRDVMINSDAFQEKTFEIVFSYVPGKTPVAKRLLIDGKDWRNALTN